MAVPAPRALRSAAADPAVGRPATPPAPPAWAGTGPPLPLYTVWGPGASVAGLIGEGGWVGPVLLLLALAALGFSWRRRRPDGFTVGIAAALLAFYVVLGLNRAQIGYQPSRPGRDVYAGAPFSLLLLAD